MKHVMFFIETLGGGGAEKVLLDIVKNIDKEKFKISVLTISNSGVYTEEIKKYCNFKSWVDINYLNKGVIYSFFYKIKYKLIYILPAKISSFLLFYSVCADIGVGFIEGFATKLVSVDNKRFKKKICWVHVDPIERNYADDYFKNNQEQLHCYNSFDKIICVSNSVKNSFLEKHNIDYKNRVLVQYNPIDVKNIKKLSNLPSQVVLRSEFNMISIGRLVNQKGFDRLIKAISSIKDLHSNFKLYILGEGIEKNNLIKLIKQYDLENYVELIGFQVNPYNILKQAQLLVCSSRAEGFGLVIEEALILGVPVLSTNCSGPNEVLQYGKYGMIVDNSDDKLCLGLKEIICNKKLYQDYKNKLVKYESRFDINKIIKEIEEIFKNV